jgi:hypothetical protein
MQIDDKIMPHTVFVVGAGASQELRLPIGSGLKDKISEALDFRLDFGEATSGDRIIFNAIKLLSGDSDSRRNLLEAADRIKNGIVQAFSIDNFIHIHQDNPSIVSCGKLAIVNSILRAEETSPLYVDRNNSMPYFPSFSDTWHNSFIKRITENCKISDLSARLKSMAFVIFNYDRCVEEYLYYSLQNIYGISNNEAAKFVSQIRIFHPYGVVGRLPWQEGNDESIKFGGKAEPEKLIKLSKEIKTFTEGTDPNESQIIQIREMMHSANRIVFLGFAFAEQNMDLLCPVSHHPLGIKMGPEKKIVYGTSMGISHSDRKEIIEDIKYRLNIGLIPKGTVLNPDIIEIGHDMECRRLFEEYQRTLSFNRDI